jgi:predicted nucleotidyltransferase
MSQLVTETYGPVPVLRELLDRIERVDRAFIYGSWAARRSGQEGPPPRDLDVLVIGQPSRVDLLEVADEASRRLGVEVNIRAIPADAWAVKADPFLQTVATRPIVELTRAVTSVG